MNLEQIRKKVRLGQWRISKHAIVEAVKDGLSPRDIKNVILTSKIIESYPERERHLIYGVLSNDMPVHVVIDYSDNRLIVVVTTYIPSQLPLLNHRFRRGLSGRHTQGKN